MPETQEILTVIRTELAKVGTKLEAQDEKTEAGFKQLSTKIEAVITQLNGNGSGLAFQVPMIQADAKVVKEDLKALRDEFKDYVKEEHGKRTWLTRLVVGGFVSGLVAFVIAAVTAFVKKA